MTTRRKREPTREELERWKDEEACSRALEIASANPEWAKDIVARQEVGFTLEEIGKTIATKLQMRDLGYELEPWRPAPCDADAGGIRDDEEVLAMLQRLLAAGLSRYEPEITKNLPLAEEYYAKQDAKPSADDERPSA